MTANEAILDATISHQVDLQRYSNGVVRRLIALLNRADADLFARLTAELERLPSFNAERLEAILQSVRYINVQAHSQLDRELTEELKRFVAAEAVFQQRLFESAIPAQIQAAVAITSLVPEQVYAAAYSQPFSGKLLREFGADLEASKMRRIRDTIRIGYVEQQTIPEIVRRVRGTRAKGYSDGVIEIDRNHAEAMVRTAISHVAGFTRDRFYDSNDDLIQAIEWVATLDARTTTECAVRDGKLYTLDKKPKGHSIPWLSGPGRLHIRCRSTSVPVLKSWKDLGLDIELSPSTRASMDGQVAADVSYGQWLRGQTRERQDDILGPTRAKLMREGGLGFDRFSNDKGRWLTLEELAQRDAQAFRRVGLTA